MKKKSSVVAKGKLRTMAVRIAEMTTDYNMIMKRLTSLLERAYDAECDPSWTNSSRNRLTPKKLIKRIDQYAEELDAILPSLSAVLTSAIERV